MSGKIYNLRIIKPPGKILPLGELIDIYKDIVENCIISILKPDMLPGLCSIDNIVLNEAVSRFTSQVYPPGGTAVAFVFILFLSGAMTARQEAEGKT